LIGCKGKVFIVNNEASMVSLVAETCRKQHSAIIFPNQLKNTWNHIIGVRSYCMISITGRKLENDILIFTD
jgi:hypothetical protein